MNSLLVVSLLGIAMSSSALAALGTGRTANGKGGMGGAPVASHVPTQAFADGGFEACVPSNAPDACADWVETSANFGTPVCDAGSCGTGGGTANARTGNN